MAYLGRGIENLSDRVVLDDITTSATATYNLLLNGIAFVPSSSESLTVSLNGVIQKCGGTNPSYTVSGSSIVFASSLSASDSIDFIIAERGITLQTPSAGSVGTSQLASSAVTTAKIADDAVTKDKVLNLMYPAFHVRISSDFSLTTGTWTTVPFDTEDIDTNSTYNTTNYRFTPAISGKYYLYAHCYFVGGSTGAVQFMQVGFVKNGSTNIGENGIDFRSANGYGGSAHIHSIIDFNTTDYVTVRARIVSTGSPYIASSRERTVFGGYRIGD